MAFINKTLTGITFTDYLISTPGSAGFQLEHSYFTAEDLVIRTDAGGGGTLLTEGNDYVLTEENADLSSQVSAAVGSTRTVKHTIYISTVIYQTTPLYFSGKYIADVLHAEDLQYNQPKIVNGEDYTIRDADGFRVVVVTTGAADRTITLPALADNKSRNIRVHKIDSGVGKVIIVGDGGETIGFINAPSFELYSQGDFVELVAGAVVAHTWQVLSNSGPVLIFKNSTAVSVGGTQSGTWHNPTGHSLAVPAGVWNIDYHAEVSAADHSITWIQSFATLSTTSGSESDIDLTSSIRNDSGSGSLTVVGYLTRHKTISLSSPTTYYLNIRGDCSDADLLDNVTTRGDWGTTKIEAIRIG